MVDAFATDIAQCLDGRRRARSYADYDRIAERDRISLVGLERLAPGQPVIALVHHDDGSIDSLRLRHSYSASQLAWFHAGSALNALRASA
jgi:aconitate hydratase